MYKLKMKLLHNEENSFCTKEDLLNFKITLPLVKLDKVGSRPVSNGLIFSGDTLVDIQLVPSLLLCNVSEISIETKTKICPNEK